MQGYSQQDTKSRTAQLLQHKGRADHVVMFIVCAPGKPFWVSWTLEDSEHALLRSRESLQVSHTPASLPHCWHWLLPFWAGTALIHDSMRLMIVYCLASKGLNRQEATTQCLCMKLCLHQFACIDNVQLMQLMMLAEGRSAPACLIP